MPGKHSRPVQSAPADNPYAPAAKHSHSHRSGSHHSHHHRSHRSARKSHTVRNVILVLLLLILVAGGAGGFMLYKSARDVQAKKNLVQGQAAQIKDSLLEGNQAELISLTNQVSDELSEIQAEVHTPLWTAASFVPVVGSDIRSVRTLSDCAVDLANNALKPIANDVAGIRLADFMQDKRINTQILNSTRNAIVSVSPIVVSNAATISALPPAHIQRVANVIEKVREPLAEVGSVLEDADSLFSCLLSMLGDGGSARHYVIIAQGLSEIRAGGGFIGSVGTAEVVDGNIELGEFHSVHDVKHITSSSSFRAQISDDELEAFGDVLARDAAGVTLTPNFVRSGELTSAFWENAYDQHVDGVVAMDPVFLQRMLALTGSVIADDGTEVNGENAAAELLNNVYWRYGYEQDGNDLEDAFFNNVAHLAADHILQSLGDVDLLEFVKSIQQSGADHRLQVWMRNEDEQRFVHNAGISGALQEDVAAPELGVYANDNTWAKMAYYLDIWADWDEPVHNEDGTSTYHVTAHYRNNITEEQAASAPGYIRGGQPLKRDAGDLVETTYVMAPLGATITDYEVHEDGPMPEGSTIPDAQMTLYGRDTWRSRINIHADSEVTITFTLTLPADATGDITVRTSPLCHDTL